MNPLQARLQAALSRQSSARRAAEFRPSELLFGPQLRAQQCGLKRKLKVCGRRSGKTYEDAVDLLVSSMEPPAVPVLYVTLTRVNAKEIIWPTLVGLNREFSLGFKVREQDLELISPLGVPIQLRGAHTQQEIEKYRGKFYKKIKVDEPGSFPDRVIRPLVRDVLRPTLMDYDGELSLGGTPPPLRRGYFYEEWKRIAKKAIETGVDPETLGLFHWTVKENERFPARLAGKSIDQILADIRDEFGWTDDDPTYRREYLGEDVEDLAALLFEYREERNGQGIPGDVLHMEPLDKAVEGAVAFPIGDWAFVLSLDLGHDDNSALCCLGWRRGSKVVYLIEEWRDNKVDVTDCAEMVKAFRDRYKPRGMVIDTAGLGKMIQAEIQRRHGVYMETAEKADKPGHIKLFNTALRKSEMMASKDSYLAEEFGLVRKDPEGLAQGKLQELPAKKGGYHGNMTDAALYGWRRCWAFLEKEPEVVPNAPVIPPLPEYTRKLVEQERRRQREFERVGLD